MRRPTCFDKKLFSANMLLKKFILVSYEAKSYFYCDFQVVFFPMKKIYWENKIFKKEVVFMHGKMVESDFSEIDVFFVKQENGHILNKIISQASLYTSVFSLNFIEERKTPS